MLQPTSGNPTKGIQGHLPAYKSKWSLNPPREGHKPSEHSTGKSTKSPSNNSQFVGYGFGDAMNEKATDSPKKHIEDSSIHVEEENEEKFADAKPPADDTIAVLLLPTDPHRNPPTVADAGEDRGSHQP
jgi:hypothetical protein